MILDISSKISVTFTIQYSERSGTTTFGVKIDWSGRVWCPVSTQAGIWDTHVKDMGKAVCSSFSRSPAQKVRSDKLSEKTLFLDRWSYSLHAIPWLVETFANKKMVFADSVIFPEGVVPDKFHCTIIYLYHGSLPDAELFNGDINRWKSGWQLGQIHPLIIEVLFTF